MSTEFNTSLVKIQLRYALKTFVECKWVKVYIIYRRYRLHFLQVIGKTQGGEYIYFKCVCALKMVVEHLRLGQYSCRLASALTTVTKTTVNTHLPSQRR